MIVPYLHGFGTTRFLSDDTSRNGHQAAIALDAIELLDRTARSFDNPDHVGIVIHNYRWRLSLAGSITQTH